MRNRNGKDQTPLTIDCIEGRWRDEIISDVFELWIGISRLMSKMPQTQHRCESAIRATKQRPAKKSVIRRPQRRNAA